MKRVLAVLIALTMLLLALPTALAATVVAPTELVAGDFRAVQNGARCYAYATIDGIERQIFRTNGAGENGTLTDLIVLNYPNNGIRGYNGRAFMVVKHYNKGYIIVTNIESRSYKSQPQWALLDDPRLDTVYSRSVALKVIEDTFGPIELIVGDFKAVQYPTSGRCTAYRMINGAYKQIFRTNGSGEDGTLIDLLVDYNAPDSVRGYAGRAYMVVKHYNKGYLLVTNDETRAYGSQPQWVVIDDQCLNTAYTPAKAWEVINKTCGCY